MSTTFGIAHWLSGRVRRFHTSDTGIEQNNADHSWGVAMLVDLLYPEAPAHLLRAAIRHDMGEAVVGDIAATAKWSHPELADVSRQIEAARLEFLYGETRVEAMPFLTAEERTILKSCDMLELCIRAAYEYSKGNRFAWEIFYNGAGFLRQHAAPEPVLRLLEAVEAEWVHI